MTELHPSIKKILKNVDEQYSKIQILAIIRHLQQEGRMNENIAEDLTLALLQLTSEMDPMEEIRTLEFIHKEISRVIHEIMSQKSEIN